MSLKEKMTRRNQIFVCLYPTKYRTKYNSPIKLQISDLDTWHKCKQRRTEEWLLLARHKQYNKMWSWRGFVCANTSSILYILYILIWKGCGPHFSFGLMVHSSEITKLPMHTQDTGHLFLTQKTKFSIFTNKL